MYVPTRLKSYVLPCLDSNQTTYLDSPSHSLSLHRRTDFKKKEKNLDSLHYDFASATLRFYQMAL